MHRFWIAGGAAVLVAAVVVLSGCASSVSPAKAADVVPISVKVTPIFADPLKPLLQVETTLSDAGATDCVLLFFYDVRDQAGADPHVHLDADDFLKLDADARRRRFSTNDNTYTMFVEVKALRTVATRVNVVAMSEKSQKGAYGHGELPAAAQP
jgi:hypothetical protein